MQFEHENDGSMGQIIVIKIVIIILLILIIIIMIIVIIIVIKIVIIIESNNCSDSCNNINIIYLISLIQAYGIIEIM